MSMVNNDTAEGVRSLQVLRHKGVYDRHDVTQEFIIDGFIGFLSELQIRNVMIIIILP